MAKRQSTSNVYRRRSRDLTKPGSHGVANAAKPLRRRSSGAAGGQLAEVLRNEHGRLADALSVLTCVYTALLHADDYEVADQPAYAKAVAIALSLVREAANQLDAAWLARSAEDLSSTVPQRSASPERH